MYTWVRSVSPKTACMLLVQTIKCFEAANNVISESEPQAVPETPASIGETVIMEETPAPKQPTLSKKPSLEPMTSEMGEAKPATSPRPAPAKKPSLEPMMPDGHKKPAQQHSNREMKPRYPAPEGVTPRGSSKPKTEPMG